MTMRCRSRRRTPRQEADITIDWDYSGRTCAFEAARHEQSQALGAEKLAKPRWLDAATFHADKLSLGRGTATLAA